MMFVFYNRPLSQEISNIFQTWTCMYVFNYSLNTRQSLVLREHRPAKPVNWTSFRSSCPKIRVERCRPFLTFSAPGCYIQGTHNPILLLYNMFFLPEVIFFRNFYLSINGSYFYKITINDVDPDPHYGRPPESGSEKAIFPSNLC